MIFYYFNLGSVLIRKDCTEFVVRLFFLHNQMTDRQARKELCKELANYKPSHYSRSLALYQRRTLGRVDPILRAIALPCPLASRFPVYKTLRAAAKIMLLNEMELVVTALVIQESQWNISDAGIIENEDGVGELLSYSNETSEYRRLSLYILLVSWAAKTALNEDCQEMLNEVRKVCFNFKSIFQQWVQPHSAALNLHPALLNRLYSHHLHPLASAHDYQLMVDTILQLSQAYNIEKDPLTHPLSRSSSPQKSKTAEKSKIFHIEAVFKPCEFERIEKEERPYEQEMNVFGNKELTQSVPFPGLFGSSVGGFLNLGSLNISKEQSNFEYFEIELGDGENNFMVFSQGDPTLSGFLGIQRASSNSDQFMQREYDSHSEC